MRIYTSESIPVDFCRDCFPPEQESIEKFGNLGDGPDGRGNCFAYDEEHPPYQETDYKCHSCGDELTEKDN
jgi:hypothetical protein